MRCPLSLPLLLLAATACGSASVSLEDGTDAHGAADYEAILDAWTREVEVVAVTGGFENVLTGHATYRSWTYRKTYVQRYAADHDLSMARRDELLARQRAAHAAAHEFFLSAYTGDRRSLELGTEDSAWRVSLATDAGVEAEPIEIERIRRPTASTRAYYPYVSATRMSFVLRFPTEVSGRPVLTPATKWFALRFDGALGHAEFRWKLD